MPLPSLRGRLQFGDTRAIQFALLIGSMVLAPYLTHTPTPEWTRWFVVIGAAALALPKPSAAVGPRRFRTRLSNIAAVSIAALSWRFAWGDPWSSLAFVPLWVLSLVALDASPRWPKVRLPVAIRLRLPNQLDISIGETIGVALALRFGQFFLPALPKSAAVVGWSALAWFVGRQFGSFSRVGRSALVDTGALAGSITALVGALALTTPAPVRSWLVVGVWLFLGLSVYRRANAAWRRQNPQGAWAENLRWILLCLVGCWLLRGFYRISLHGTADALWYGTLIADMTEQVRKGIFPVWVGQSVYRFNGAIYPIRVAPLYPYLGALLDTLTFRQLDPLAIQNLLITLIGLAGTSSAYLVFRSLSGNRGWLAAGLATLFICCPGVLGIAYNTDLYMSWTTLPWIPWVWLACARSFHDGGSARTMALLGVTLGLCWWGHSPIALWATVVAGITQLVRLARQVVQSRTLLDAAVGGGCFLTVAAYPIGSVLFFPPEPGVSASSFQIATAGVIAYFVREVFPATLHPLSAEGRLLSDFQLGYGLWAIWVAGACLTWRSRRTDLWVFWAIATSIMILLTPWPKGIDEHLWALVPGFIRNTTGNWVMNRLYLILALTLLTGFALARATWVPSTKIFAVIPTSLVLLACGWGLIEAQKFVVGSNAHPRMEDRAGDPLRPENVQITRFAYVVYPRLPATFSHGVMEPALEQRLLSLDGSTVLLDAHRAALEQGRVATTGTLKPKREQPTWLISPEPLSLAVGRRYLLRITAPPGSKVDGTLQLIGDSLFREYSLPEYGEPLSFGFGGQHRDVLPLWTSRTEGEQVSIRFLSNVQGSQPSLAYSLIEYDPHTLPVALESLMPFQVRVRSSAAALLETPKMYQPYYVARLNGQKTRIRKSSLGLVAVEVPAGNSTIELSYEPPAGLVCLFWISLTAIFSGLWWLMVRTSPTPSAARSA